MGQGVLPRLSDVSALLKKSYHFGKDDLTMLIKPTMIVLGVAIEEFNGLCYVTWTTAEFLLEVEEPEEPGKGTT